MLALSILGLLMGDPLHGYEIRKQLSELLGISGAISYGSLYPTLAKLHRQGLIDTQLGQAPLTINKKTKIFSTGSLSGDLAVGTKSPFARTPLLSSRKTKKVYTITEKGMQAFKEKLLSSYVEHADDDRAFVAHLAFLDFASDDEKTIFIDSRIMALKTRLTQIRTTNNHKLKLWNEVEREHIEKQIAFLGSINQDQSTEMLTKTQRPKEKVEK